MGHHGPAVTDPDAIATTKLPVTVLSGFLGAGMTSMLRHVLTNHDQLRVTVI